MSRRSTRGTTGQNADASPLADALAAESVAGGGRRRSSRAGLAAEEEKQQQVKIEESQKPSTAAAAAASKPNGSKRSRAAAMPEDDVEFAGEDEEDAPPPSKRQHNKKGASQTPAAPAAGASPPAAAAAAAAAVPALKLGEDDEDDEAAAAAADVGAMIDGSPVDPDDPEAMAASLGLSVYEFNRQQNIRLKNEQLSLLNLSGMASEIGLKRASGGGAAAAGRKREKKAPQEGFRRSLRSSVRDPNYVPPDPIYVPELTSSSSGWGRPDRPEGPLAFADALADKEQEASETKEMENVLATLKSTLTLADAATAAAAAAAEAAYAAPRAISQSSMPMLGEGPKIIRSRATMLSFHPTASLHSNLSVLAAGDKNGHMSITSFANDAPVAKWIDTVQLAQYRPHVGTIVELQWGSAAERHALYSASRDGSVRRMDVEAGIFDEVWVEDENDGSSLSGMCLSPDRSMLYVADRAGVVHVLDTRASGSSRVKAKSKAAQKLQLSENAINSLSINPMDGHMLASAGKDRSVRVWDLRAVKTDKPLNSWAHNYSVNSVEFSPSGRMMASTSYDNTIKLFSCVNSAGALISPTNWAAPHVIRHNTTTGRWVTVFKARFAPRDAALAVGDMNRPIAIFNLPSLAAAPSNGAAAAAAAAGTSAAAAAASPAASRAAASSSPVGFAKGVGVAAPVPAPVLSLKHPEFVTSIPAAIAWHPTRVQVAGCTSSGRLYVYGRG